MRDDNTPHTTPDSPEHMAKADRAIQAIRDRYPRAPLDEVVQLARIYRLAAELMKICDPNHVVVSVCIAHAHHNGRPPYTTPDDDRG